MTDLSNVETVFTYAELSTKERFVIFYFVILHDSIPKLRIGDQFDDVSDSNNVSGEEEPSFPIIEFSAQQNESLPYESHISIKKNLHKG